MAAVLGRTRQSASRAWAVETENRVYNTLRGLALDRRRLGEHQLQDPDFEIIWKWAGSKHDFFRQAVEHTDPPSDPGRSDPGLNSVCSLLVRMQTQGRIDIVRCRLLQYFLARFVAKFIPDVKNTTEVARLMVESGWIAKGVTLNLEKNLQAWLAAGRCYEQLAAELGGAGALLLLLLIGWSSWEVHCHPTRPYGNPICQLLVDMGVPEAANVVHWASNVEAFLNAHELVDNLVHDLFQECHPDAVCFVSAPSSKPARTKGRGIRSSRFAPRFAPYPESGHARRPQNTPPFDSPHAVSPEFSGQVPVFSIHPGPDDDDLCRVLSGPPTPLDGVCIPPFSPSTPRIETTGVL